MMKKIIAWILVLIVCGGLIFAHLLWLSRYEKRTAVNILASLEPELGLPIYSQFVVTQKINFEKLTSVTNISFPVYFPVEGYKLQIDMLRKGKLLERWRYEPKNPGEVEEAALPVRPPRLLEGDAEIRFSAVEIGHEDKDNVPRIFTDPEDGAYAGGNYRISENEKEGDVAMRIDERIRRWDKQIEFWEDEPIELALYVLKLLLVLFLVGAVPFLFI